MEPVFNFGCWLDGRKYGSAEKYYKNFLKFNPMHEKDLVAFLNKANARDFMTPFRTDIVPEGEEYWNSLIKQWHFFSTFLFIQQYQIQFTYLTNERVSEKDKIINVFEEPLEKQFKEELI
jgi:hypothetical protein